jgi:RNA polymerase sigma-70 factor (ECF subfamily)
MTTGLDEEVARAWPRLLASLVRELGSVELAEDALQDAWIRASSRTDIADPAAWVLTAARRIAIDSLRREAALRRRLPQLAEVPGSGPTTARDDRVELLLLACDPVVPADARLPLALRFVCGVPTGTIADALHVQHSAMSARLTRAKRRVDEAGRRLGSADPARLPDALAVVHVMYTVGHTAVEGDRLVLPDVPRTAIALADEIVRAHPGDAEARGLLALLLFTEARQPGRLDDDGRAITLERADRSTWDLGLARRALPLATMALAGGGRLGLEAGIAGMHTMAPSWETTDWAAIVALYDRLVERWPSPSARIARALAIGYGSGGPAAGLAALDELPRPAAGAGARQYVVARADLLRRAGRTQEARLAYLEARAMERNEVLAGFLDERLAALDESPPPGSEGGGLSWRR